MRKIYSDKVATAGVSITDGINLYINPKFFLGLSLVEQVEVMIHECEHLVKFHQVRFAEIQEGDAKIYNVAADATINQPLKSLHGMGVTVARLNEFYPNKDFKLEDASEDHYEKLMEEKKQLMQDIADGKVKLVDDHSVWEETDNKDYAKSILIDTIEKSVKDAGAGRTPSHVLEELDLIKKSMVDWKQILRRFVSRSAANKKEKTRMKRNRRYGTMFQGKKKAPNLVLTLLIDESGSVCDDQFTQFFAEIEKIMPLVEKLYLVHFDAEVKTPYEYKKGAKIVRTGRGGTLFKPAFDKAHELKSDAVICFTDGYPCDDIEKPKFPLLWASTQRDERPFDFGDFLRVKVAE
jgi:predicted metal-dependent peptidase